MISRKFIQVLSLLTASFLLLTACHSSRHVKGDGEQAHETRPIENFTAIHSHGDFALNIAASSPTELQLTADKNILPLIHTRIDNGILVIEPANHVSILPSKTPTFNITTKNLNDIEVFGAGKVNAKKLNTDQLNIELRGSGTFQLSGEAKHLIITLRGSGTVNAQNLTVATAEVIIRGSGKAIVNVKHDLKVEIMGSGNVEYIGTPSQIKSDIKGQGKIISLPKNATNNPT